MYPSSFIDVLETSFLLLTLRRRPSLLEPLDFEVTSGDLDFPGDSVDFSGDLEVSGALAGDFLGDFLGEGSGDDSIFLASGGGVGILSISITVKEECWSVIFSCAAKEQVKDILLQCGFSLITLRGCIKAGSPINHYY